MGITPGKVACAAAIGIGASVLLAACAGGGGKRPAPDGPMSDLTTDLMQRLKPGVPAGSAKLSVANDAVRAVTSDGRATGAYDGTRLLRAADAHAYGTPTIGDPQVDVQDDGFATWNEVRQIARHFDADASGVFDAGETRAFEAAVGIRWLPA